MSLQQKSNRQLQDQCVAGKGCMVSSMNSKAGKTSPKLRGKVGTSISGPSQDHDEVIVWQGKNDVLGESSMSEGSGPVCEMPNPTVKRQDSLPPAYVPLKQLKSLKEIEARIDSSSSKNSSSKQHTPTISSKPQRSKAKAPNKNEQRGGIGDGPLGVKEMIQRGGSDKKQQSGNSGGSKEQMPKSGKKPETVQMKEKTNDAKGPLHGNAERKGRKIEQGRGKKEIQPFKERNTMSSGEPLSDIDGQKMLNVPRKSEEIVKQQVRIEISTATEKEASCQGKVPDGHKVKNGIVDHSLQWRVKISPKASRMIANDIPSFPKLEGPLLIGNFTTKEITERPNKGGQSFENAKEIGGKGNGRHNALRRGPDGEGEADLQHGKNQDGVSEESGVKGISVSCPFSQSQSVELQDTLPPGYVPLKQLQGSKESETKNECRSKIPTSRQHVYKVLNKPPKSNDSTSNKNVQSQSGNAGIGDGPLDKNKLRQTGNSETDNKAPDKNKQRQSGNLRASKCQTGNILKNCGAARMNETNFEGPLHGNVERGNTKLEQSEGKKKHEDLNHGNQNKHKEPLLKGTSTLEGADGRFNTDRESLKNSKEIGSSVNERHDFLGNESNVEGKINLKNAENQDVVFTELGGEGICVSYPFPFQNDRPLSIKRGEGQTTPIFVTNNGKISVKLFEVKFRYLRPRNSFSFSHTTGPVKSIQGENLSLDVKTKSKKISQFNTDSLSLMGGPWLIEPRHHLIIHLSCMAKDIGLHRTTILFNFNDQKIPRHVTILAEDDVSAQLAPREPYSRSRNKKPKSFERFICGEPPPLPGFPKKLDAYHIPKNLQKTGAKNLPRVLEEGLSMESYSKYFSTLLYLEELQLQEDMSFYALHNVTMSKSGQYLVLRVPGLSEKRPSLVYRDQIYVTASGAKGNTYQGYIHRIEANEIHVKFDNSFHRNFIPNLHYDVHFSFSRVNLRRCHQAVDAVGRIDESFFFPCTFLTRRIWKNVAKNDPFNRSLNKEQLSAVHKIVNSYGSPPYLVYGPPGTGKTATLVEAILQVLRSNSKAHILACAPSNVASDLLVERLIGPIQKGEIFRLNAFSRPINDVQQNILPYCSYTDMFYCPPLEELLKYKIIVSTYLSAAMLDAQEVPQGHFTHIFLDEAAQGTEPETLVPIANLANAETTVVLAGDPQQLGPVIHSSIAEKFGLGKSYFERLSDLQLYSLDGDNNQFVTKLVRNYRSHPAILELPSRLFYESTLIACATNEIQKLHCGWDELPNKKFPVVFVGIEGCDERESTSPSWFNTVEVSKVLEIIKKLKEEKKNKVTGKDIGVITPYHQQVIKLKKAFAASTLSDVKVGSVEQFQGDEKRVIIISTVRSSYENEEFDQKYNLGFIGHPKRFNVAITRAKSLLIVVGNPYILNKDKYWNELLQYCVNHKSYIGCSFPPQSYEDEFPPGECSADSGTSRPIEDMEWPDGTW